MDAVEKVQPQNEEPQGMTNIEIKATYTDRERAEQILNSLGAGPAGVFQQRDTYFNVSQGRLKLRQLGPDDG